MQPLPPPPLLPPLPRLLPWHHDLSVPPLLPSPSLQERLATYEQRVRKAITADELARTRPGASLDIAAVNRFIDAAIPDLTSAQHAALRGTRKAPTAGEEVVVQKPAAAYTNGGGQDGSVSHSGGSSGGDDGRLQQQQQVSGVHSSLLHGSGNPGVVKQGDPGSSTPLSPRPRDGQSKRRRSGAQHSASDDAQRFLQQVLLDADAPGHGAADAQQQ